LSIALKGQEYFSQSPQRHRDSRDTASYSTDYADYADILETGLNGSLEKMGTCEAEK
jgi:hypothetical protein